MVPASGNHLPKTRGQALHLLRSVDDRVNLLTPQQRQRIRELYRLDDDRSVEQLIIDREIPP